VICNFENLIRKFSAMKCVVLGDVMLDLYEFCYTDESKPIDSEKAGKRAYRAKDSVRALGGAGNVASNLASLGVQTSLIGVTGDDGHNFTLQQMSDQIGIRHCFVRDRGRPTTTKNRLYVDDEYLLRRDDESTEPITRELSLTLLDEALCELDGAKVVVLSDYNKGVFSEEFAQEIIAACRERELPVVVDFKPPNKAFFRSATVMIPNRSEAHEIVSGFDDSESYESSLITLRETLGCGNVAVTLGREGICGYDGTNCFYIAGNDVPEVDAVGCGDTIRGVLALGYALGLSLKDAADLANDAAGVIVQKKATAMLSQEELIGFLDGKYGTSE